MIIEAVKELSNTQGAFSIWEVTNWLRQRYEWGDLEYTDLNGNLQDIPALIVHKTVRSLFERMDWGEYDIVQTAPYRIFQKKQGVVTQQPTVAVSNQTGMVRPSWTGWQDIAKYLDAHGDKTTKQIQSAMRVNGVTCNDIQQLAQQNGAKVQTHPYPSKTVIGL